MLPLPPQTVTTAYHDHPRHDFTIDGHSFIIVEPARPAPGRPWLWRAEFFGAFDSVDAAMLRHGWHIVHCPSAAGLFGSPRAVNEWDDCYPFLTGAFGLHPRFVAEGFSRGGLLTCNFAARFPDRIAAMYNDAPVLDIRSWPGGKAAGRASPGDAACWQQCLACYGLTEHSARVFSGNPIDRAAELASHRIPIIHVVGDKDVTVPVDENSNVFEQRHRAAGGDMRVIHKPDCDHHPHSLEDPTPVVDFLLNAWRAASLGRRA